MYQCGWFPPYLASYMKSSLNLFVFFFSLLLTFHRGDNRIEKDTIVWHEPAKRKIDFHIKNHKCPTNECQRPFLFRIISNEQRNRENIIANNFQCSWKFIAIVWLLCVRLWINLCWIGERATHWIWNRNRNRKVKSSKVFHRLIHFHSF